MINWATLYITGKRDFREEVRKRIANSKLNVMPGYVEQSVGENFYDLYWLDEAASLRDVKEVIGSKLIWRYRLRFYNDLEQFLQEVNNKSMNQRSEAANSQFPVPFFG